MRSYRTDRRRGLVKCLVPLFLLFACVGECAAALGESAAQSPQKSATAMSGVTSAAAGYVRRDTTLPSGTHVREYISNRGIVFGVTWDGPVLPDLRELLGKHFDSMVAESARRPKAGRSRLDVNRPEVMISSGGHMRAFEGSAWVPAEFPAGFTVDDAR